MLLLLGEAFVEHLQRLELSRGDVRIVFDHLKRQQPAVAASARRYLGLRCHHGSNIGEESLGTRRKLARALELLFELKQLLS